jgi:acyl-ACP thioesterase
MRMKKRVRVRSVTSTRYIDWMMDCFPASYHENHYPEKLSINYAKEILPGKKIRLLRTKNGREEYDFEGKDVGENVSHFKGRIGFALQNSGRLRYN